MKPNSKLLLFGVVTVIALIITFSLPRMPQPQAYHSFADQVTMFGIPNFLNVASNFLFIVFGVYGLLLLRRSNANTSLNIIYAVVFLGVLLTGFGSGYYHYSPNNDTLVYDRIPMTLVFMGFLCATIAELINEKAGIMLLLPLLLLGIFSVLWWHYTELEGKGDLRLYGFVQFYPVLAVPLIIFLFPSKDRHKSLRLLILVVIWYVIAKLFEHFDKQVYSIAGFISGHSLKHIAAAIATLYIVKIFSDKYVAKVTL